MTNDSKKESKSIGRNIFAESKYDLFKDKPDPTQSQPAVLKDDGVSKSIGRNIFLETQQQPTSSSKQGSEVEDLKIIEKSTRDFKEKKSTTTVGSKQSRINAIHITNDNVVFAQTIYDGVKYKLTNSI